MPDIPPEVIANWLLNTANSIIQEKQEEDWFNRFLLGNFGFPWLARLFLLTVTILFLFMALRWLRRGLRKAEPTSTLTKNVQTSLLPRGGVLRQRTASQIEVGNLHEAARRRVRSQFDVLGAAPNASGKMPPVLTANDLPDGLLMQQTIRWLWAVGYGESPVRDLAGGMGPAQRSARTHDRPRCPRRLVVRPGGVKSAQPFRSPLLS